MTATASAIDWNAIFQFLLLVGGAVIGWQQRRAAKKAKEAADTAKVADERSQAVEAKVKQIAIQTDGLLKHLQGVARKEGVLEGIEAADMAGLIAKKATTEAAERVAEKMKDLGASGELGSGVFEDLDAELKTLMKTIEEDRKRLIRPSGPR